jgi:hypothetical protein
LTTPSSKSAIETFLPNSPLPRTMNHKIKTQNKIKAIPSSWHQSHKNTPQNHLEPLTYNKQLHIFISTQEEEEYLSTNYYSMVFCFWQMTLSIGSSSKIFSSYSFSSHKMISCFYTCKGWYESNPTWFWVMLCLVNVMLLPKGQGFKLSKIHPSFSPPFFSLLCFHMIPISLWNTLILGLFMSM